MNLWKRTDAKSRAVVESAALCKRRDEHEATWLEADKKWHEVDQQQVLPAAAVLATALNTANHDRILAAREILKRHIWERDAHRADFQRQLSEMNGEIEALSAPVIAEKCTEWTAALSELRSKKAYEGGAKSRDMADERLPRMVTFSSNFETIIEAREGLLSAIRTLRDMRQRPLSEIHAFIERTEAAMRKFDFGIMKESKTPVSERAYLEQIAGPEIERRPPDGSTDKFAERFFRSSGLTRA
jgi:hypothetical protein